MKKENFKIFVRNHPNLINYVRDNKMTWQQFYELYDLYGEDNSIWQEFNSLENNLNTNTITTATNVFGSLKELFNMFKGIDLNNVQKTLTSLDKAIDAFKEIRIDKNEKENIYEERPKYKYFED